MGASEGDVRHVRARELWWMFVVAALRSKFGAVVLLLMVTVTIYLFAKGRVGGGAFLFGATLFIFGRVPAAIGAYIGTRTNPRNRGDA